MLNAPSLLDASPFIVSSFYSVILFEFSFSSIQLFSKLSTTIVAHGFAQSKSDYSMFTRVHNGIIIIILVYVDDILVASNDVQAVTDSRAFG